MDKKSSHEQNTSLYVFCYHFLGPICSEYFVALDQYAITKKPFSLGFLARKGYLFKEIHQALIDKGSITSLKIKDLTLLFTTGGYTQKQIGDDFGLHSYQISRIVAKYKSRPQFRGGLLSGEQK
jgi:hypothetical protein